MNQVKNNRVYPAILERKDTGYGDIIPDIPGAFALGGSVEETQKNLSEVLTIMLDDYAECGVPPPPRSTTVNPADYGFAAGAEVHEITAAAVNPSSLEIERAITASGLTRTAIARRMGTSASVSSRLTNPFYFGHSVSLLQRFAEAVNGQLEVKIVPTHLQDASRRIAVGLEMQCLTCWLCGQTDFALPTKPPSG